MGFAGVHQHKVRLAPHWHNLVLSSVLRAVHYPITTQRQYVAWGLLCGRISRVFQQIEKIDVSLALLSRYRNSLQPFHRLSSDILILIFLEIQEDEWNPFGSTFGAYSYMGFTKVCHTWRQIALSASILWRQISTRYPSAALAALERSSGAGICLSIPSGYHSGDKAAEVIKVVAAQMHRLRWLYVPSDLLKTSDGTIDPLLAQLLDSPAPMLEMMETQKIRGDGDCRPLQPIFKGDTPLLHRLRVHYVQPQLTSLSLGRLKYLAFSGKKPMPITMSVSSLLDLLEKCPLLEIFKTEKVSWQAAPEDDKRKVELEHLKYLEMGRATGSLMADIIGRIIAPEYAMKLKVFLDRYEDNKFYMGIPLDHELEPGHHLRGTRKVFLNYLSGYEGICITGSTAKYPFEIHGLLEDSTITNLGDMDNVAGMVFQSFVRGFCCDDLEEFAICDQRMHSRWTGFTKKLWTELFRRAPKLRAFYCTADPGYDEGFARPVLAALATSETGRMLCPALEDVFVSGDKTWSSLQCFIVAEMRAQAGHPLKRVSMRLPHYASFSDPEETDLPMLRKYVEKVDLDPPEMTFPEYPEIS